MPRVTLSRVFLLFLIVFISSILFLTLHFDNEKQSDTHGNGETGRKIFKRIPEKPSFDLNKIDDNAYVVTTFVDERNGNMGYRYVRSVLVLDRQYAFDCEINGKASAETKLYEMSENHNQRMQVFVLNCKLPDDVSFEDVHDVNIKKKGSSGFKTVPVNHRVRVEKTYMSYPIQMSICVPVIFGNRYKAKNIIEFIELNTLQGVERMYMYYNPTDISPSVNKTLRYYADNHAIELIPFVLPFNPDNIWYHGQLVSIADCLLRNTGISKYTFFHDLDEMFVPMTKRTMLQTLDNLFGDKVGAQRVALNYVSSVEKDGMVTLDSIDTEKILERRLTKCVIRPEMVFEQGIHHTSRVIQDDSKIEDHDGSQLRVLHYKPNRYCCDKNTVIRDRYGSKLKEQFEYVAKTLRV